MKAAVRTKYGPPSVLQIKDVDIPTPSDNEVLIKVYASTVNRTDCGFLRAKPFIVRFFSGLMRPKYTILGNEFAGKVVKVGNGVVEFKMGDKVFGYDGVRFGGHAEYTVMNQHDLIAKIPKGMTYIEAAPMSEAAHYALAYIRATKMKKGQKVLVNGASGGIGSAAVQMISELGVEVTAVCETKHIALVKSLGAKKVVDYTKKDFTKLNEKFDVVFDAVGKSSFKKCLPILKTKGIYTSSELGFLAQNPFLALLSPLMRGKKLMFPIPRDKKEDIVYLKQLAEAGIYKPVIDRTYTLAQIAEAYEYVEKGYKVGNVVITLSK